MQTIYWIQRLGVIHTISWVVFGISCFILLICFFVLAEIDFDRTLKGYESAWKCVKILIRIVVPTLLLGIFIPSQEQLYVIYGVGGTIEYLKENDTAKQLPDKCINALDAWVDKITPKEEEK